MNGPLLILGLFTALFVNTRIAHAQQEIGHFAPGVLNIRDLAIPELGFYGVLYNYWYTTDRVNDSDGNEMNSVKVGPAPGTTIDVNMLNFHYFYEFAAKDRFQGESIGLNFAIKF